MSTGAKRQTTPRPTRSSISLIIIGCSTLPSAELFDSSALKAPAVFKNKLVSLCKMNDSVAPHAPGHMPAFTAPCQCDSDDCDC